MVELFSLCYISLLPISFGYKFLIQLSIKFYFIFYSQLVKFTLVELDFAEYSSSRSLERKRYVSMYSLHYVYMDICGWLVLLHLRWSLYCCLIGLILLLNTFAFVNNKWFSLKRYTGTDRYRNILFLCPNWNDVWSVFTTLV